MVINQITAKKILASMGNETVEVTINNSFSASVPAGISAGKYEIKKVSPDEAIDQINQISQICSGKDWTQETLDREISSHDFGGNATLAVSSAFYKASNTGLHPVTNWPKIMLLLFEGGEHGNKNITMQEFMIIEDGVNQASEDFAKLKYYLKQNNLESTVGAEGGFSPLAFDNGQVLSVIREIFPGRQIAIDMASSFHSGTVPEDIFSVEDPFDDESWDQWRVLNQQNKFLVVGDDLTTTNSERIKKAIDLKAIGGVVIKPNQIGTISGALEAVKIAREGGLKIVVSHRGEETDDTWIVDFALTCSADFVKFGGLDRGERIAKYNRLMELGMK